jgi:hypothetical protein
MSDFLSSAKDLGSQAIRNNIDKSRNLFLKGLKTTSAGQKEDPTYLGFRLMFDYGYGGRVDPETYLPISPLFCDIPHNGLGMDYFSLSKEIRLPGQGNYTENVAYYSAQGYLRQRATTEEYGKFGTHSVREQSLHGFKDMLRNINEKAPWFIQSVSGLETLLKVQMGRQVSGEAGYRAARSGTLSFGCMESIDMRVAAMADLYRKATYDYVNSREAIPANLKKFRMWIIVTEIRQIDLQRNIADVINPFNIPAVRNVADNISNIAQSAGINFGQKGGDPGKSDNPMKDVDNLVKDMERLQPYIYVYQCDLCEFNFDDYKHLGTSIDNKGTNSPVTNEFKIDVGRITEHKLQYNILSDLVENKSTFAPILIADSWNMLESHIPKMDFNAGNNAGLLKQMASKFIMNSVSNVIQDFTPKINQALLGNIYGFQLTDVTNLANSFQDAVAGIKNIKSPFEDYKPQTKGLGGPMERQYPKNELDVYNTVPPANSQQLGNVFPGGTGYPKLPATDLYSTSPGASLGLPTRVYPIIKVDEFNNVPGSDLGVPGRVYTKNNTDEYTTNPGSDLGLPARVYPSLSDDQYANVPGTDLGTPLRVYPPNNTDLYTDNPGADLGLPARVYPPASGDEYADVPGNDLGAPLRVYNTNSIDEYVNNPGSDLGAPMRVYPPSSGDEYNDVPGKDLGPIGRVYPVNKLDEYPDNPGKDLGLPDRTYPTV